MEFHVIKRGRIMRDWDQLAENISNWILK